MNRKILFFILPVFLTFFLTACFDSKEVDEKAYVVALGFDKGENNFLKMTLQIAIPSKIASGEGGGEPGAGTAITTVETPTLYAGLNMINTYISKEIDLSHCKVVVFSKELAQEGIHKYIHAMVRGREFRGSMYVAVALESAEEYIQNVTPTLEANPAKYFEMNFNSYQYTGFTGDTKLTNFYLLEECSCRQAYATLVGVNKYEKSHEFDNNNSTYKERGRDRPLEGDFYAGQIPKVYDIKAEVMGIAAFDGGKMVGQFDGQDALYHSMLYGTYQSSHISVPDPKQPENFILLDVKQSRKPSHHVEMVNNAPVNSAEIKLEADILSIQSGINYESKENIPILEKTAEDFLEKGILKFLEKTRPMHADLCGFGRDLKMKYLLWEDWGKVQWLKKYAQSKFNVKVELKIRRPGLMVKTAPAKSSEGDVMD